jgi:Asp-tRNA(Asn)/Glu-tRNA(Gln) amidotransferase C subunit
MTDEEVRALAAAAGIELDGERLERVRVLLERALERVARLETLPLDDVAPGPDGPA